MLFLYTGMSVNYIVFCVTVSVLTRYFCDYEYNDYLLRLLRSSAWGRYGCSGWCELCKQVSVLLCLVL